MLKIPKEEFKERIEKVKVRMEKYDIYPPLHGCGCAEAESPYPDEKSEITFQPGMTVNTDISLFGHPLGSNRLEEGFAITQEGREPFSKCVRLLSKDWLK